MTNEQQRLVVRERLNPIALMIVEGKVLEYGQPVFWNYGPPWVCSGGVGASALERGPSVHLGGQLWEHYRCGGRKRARTPKGVVAHLIQGVTWRQPEFGGCWRCRQVFGEFE